ncbi:hypothetical protein ACFY7Z_24690 [Streptomyces sp. NPDC012623]
MAFRTHGQDSRPSSARHRAFGDERSERAAAAGAPVVALFEWSVDGTPG